MQTQTDNQIETLRAQYRNIQERIMKYEDELKQPLARDMEDSAAEESSREILYGLYKVEKENLAKIESDLKELVLN